MYDAGGERVLKSNGGSQSIAVNGSTKGGKSSIGSYTIYVNPYVVLRNSQVTKHFYIESQRIATKLAESNEGLLQNKAGNATVKHPQKQAQLQGSVTKLYADLGMEIEKVTDTAGNSGNTPQGQNGGGTPPQNGNNGNGNDNTTGNAGGNSGGNGNNGNSSGGNSNGNTGSGNGTAIEKFIFYYHPDHLGSSSYISDANGEVTQHLEYFAFGETFLEEHSNTEATPYLFNGKELDEETGLYYYGARYYDARTSIWSSVDPLAEKYPNASPYAYCLNNPINAIDPDGRIVIFINGMHTGDGGRSEYWNGLDNRIMNRFGDHNAIYRDGALGGAKSLAVRGVFFGSSFFTSLIRSSLFANARMRAGRQTGYNDAAGIFGNLADGETIKLATHSMGGAYGKGYIKGLKQYAKENNIDITGRIEELDLAPYQPGSQQAEKGVPTTVVAHNGDTVAGSDPMPGTPNNNVTRQDKKTGMAEHSVDSFTQKEINDNIPQHSPSPRGGSSKIEQNPKKQ